MTNEQAIRALVDVARQWAETGADNFSDYGQGYCGAMASVLVALGQCPAGKKAIGRKPVCDLNAETSRAIKAALLDALAWDGCQPDTAIGIGCKMQAGDTLAILAGCPAGRAAMQAARKGGKERSRTAKAGQIGGEGRKTRAGLCGFV